MDTFAVKVFGSEYSVRADSDGGHVSRVAKIVDQKMREVDRQVTQASTGRTAVLACMSLVDEHLAQARDNVDWLKRRVGLLIQKLDREL